LLQNAPNHAKVAIVLIITELINTDLKLAPTQWAHPTSNKSYSNTDQSLVLSPFMKISLPIKVVSTNIKVDLLLVVTLSKLLVMVKKTD